MYILVARWFFATLSYVSRARQRLVALFFVFLTVFGAGSGTAFALSSDVASHATPAAPSRQTVPVPQTRQSAIKPAADSFTPVGSAAGLYGALHTKVNNAVLGIPAQKPTFTPHELTNKRTANSAQYLNKDGSITQTNYVTPHFYQTGGQWQPIDTTLAADNNAGDAGTIFGKAWGVVESWLSPSNAYIVNNNSWNARFAPSDYNGGMVRVKQGNGQIGFSPVHAHQVNPVITTDKDGVQTVHYNNLWDGVDVTYRVQSDQIKEAIVLKNKSAVSQVQFKLLGGSLQSAGAGQGFAIKGALGDQFGIAPANIILNNYGFIAPDKAGLTQKVSGSTYTVGISSTYLQSLPAAAFPAVIDPSTVNNSAFGTRAGGNYVSFETNGYICPSNTCNPYAGSLYDSNNTLQYWRSAFRSPYDFLQQSNTVLDSATVHLTQLTGVSWWTGSTATHNFQIGHATCLNSYTCVDGVWGSANIATSGDIDVTNLYRTVISNGDWGAWLMIMGYDGTTSSFKSFNPDYSYVQFTYHYTLPAPSFVTPAANQAFVDPQASFRVNPVANPNGSSALQYELMVTDGSSGNGTVIDSGMQNSTLWTVPDGTLRDGSTYYIQARSYDPTMNLYSGWSAPVPFKIDTRTGNTKTQTDDAFGPATVDLATGNVSTTAATHTTKALAGSLGATLTYNSPLKSRTGLVGSYWNLPSGGSGIPATAPDLQRVDQNVDFDWSSGSPGSPINTSYFAAQWNGYFVAPSAGTYYFGGVNDDTLAISINNQQVYSGGGCFSGPCYGSGVTLTAGQVVPFQVSYNQYAGSDYIHLYVKGAVSEQIVPQQWFQTGVRPVQQTSGLIGRYYRYTDAGVPPTIGSTSNTQFLTRTDPYLSFNWNAGSPIPNGPASNFLARWTGYLTAPVTGSYTFGTTSDDGSIVTINGQQVYNKWQDSPGTTGFGSAVTLTAGQSVPVVVDYYQHSGGDAFSLLVVAPGATGSQVVPTQWLSPQAQVLPNGWSLGIDPDGAAAYTQLTANQNNAVLTDSTGSTHDYTWNGSGYTPPTNEYGNLVRNTDGSFTLQDTDGKTYVFDNSGALISLTNPIDDRQPAALQYSYGSAYSGGPVRIQKITDGVNANRYAAFYYSGASQCGTPPSGFAATPANMVCAVQTNDGRTSYFYYDSFGNLIEVARPGGDLTVYQYQSVTNNAGIPVGYQLTGIRTSLANDAIAAGQRSATDATTYTQIAYDTLGRAASITEPAGTAASTQVQHTISYALNASTEHIVGAPEPNGFTKRIEYDNLFRTTKVTDAQNLSTTTTWDPVKDLAYSTTNAQGLMSTTIYDDSDRPVSQYGPAPAAWFNQWNWTLANGQGLSPGQSLWSPDHTYQLAFQTDGNVVIYGPSGAVWATHTGGPATALTMQSDGNLVLYNGSAALWSSNTQGGPSSYLTMQNDGNLVIYTSTGHTWVSNTAVIQFNDRRSPAYDAPLPAYVNQVPHTDTTYDGGMQGLAASYMDVTSPTPGNVLWNNQYIGIGQSVWSQDRRFQLTLQADGNIVLYGPNGAMWATNTAGRGTIYLVMQTDGNLVARDSNWSAVWASGTYGAGSSAHFVIQNDGNAVIYYNTGYWATNTYGWGNGLTNMPNIAGNPLLHGTNIANDGTVSHTWGASAPVSTASGNWGLSLTGQMRLPTTGVWNFAVTSDEGVNLWIDDSLVINGWGANWRAYPTVTQSGSFTNPTANAVHRFRLDYYHQNIGGIGATLSLNMTPPGGAQTSQVAQYFTPGYNLATSTTTYDSSLGNVTNTINYGSTPELGLPASSTVSSGSISLTSGSTYETPGNGYLRKTSSTLPGGALTTYSYYSATATATNPCVAGSTAAYQAGFMHTTTAATGVVTEDVYDDAGNVVAARNGTDPWTCTTYDTRGRVQQVVTPTIISRAGRTVSYSYAVGGNPLVASTTDSTTGTSTTQIDLLGRTVTNTDTFGYQTTYTYDSLGRAYQKQSLKGTETVTYDTYSRVTAYALDGITYATLTYDQYGRVASVNYPQAMNGTNNLKLSQVKYDALQQSAGATYTFSDGSMYDESVARSLQSGLVTGDTIAQGGKTVTSSYQYDGVGRLTGATIDNWQYQYGFGAQAAGCAATTANYNANAAADGNRTSYTVTNTQTSSSTATTYCYNMGDQLASSSDAQIGTPVYDTYGSVTQLAGGTTPIVFAYNASGQNTAIQQGGNQVKYTKDASGTILVKETYQNNTLTTVNRYAGDVLLTCSTTDETQCSVTDKYVALPGGVALTLKAEANNTITPVYSIQNSHGDTAITADSTGIATSSVYLYDPFGQVVASNTFSTSTTPANATDTGMGWATSPSRKQETLFTLPILQMGARIYLPTLGRFLEPDPIPGGTPNGYTYVLDPVNFSDYSGAFLGIHIHINVNTVYRIAVGAVAVAGAVAVGLAVATCVVTVVCGVAAAAAIGSLAAMTVAMGAIAVTGKPDNSVTNTAMFVSTGLEVVSAAAGSGSGSKATSSRTTSVAMQQQNELPRLGGNIIVESKIADQMSKRGWTLSRIQDAVNDPMNTVKTMDTRYNTDGTRLNDPATAYYHQGGGYVVRNDLNGKIVQVSDVFDKDWKAPW
ncbi:MAG TPA: PA14 domain-containing protein [Candidatus Saccharimonadales bacterium]|nr:PA14 domain-containing protein [Candidatus Saccharimonadales bacterium]